MTIFEHKNFLLPNSKSTVSESHAEPVSYQNFYEPKNGEFIEAPVYQRESFENGFSTKGPAIIAEEQTTTIVPIGFECYADSLGNIILERADG